MNNTYYSTKANLLKLIRSIAVNYTVSNDFYHVQFIEYFSEENVNQILWLKLFLQQPFKVANYIGGIIQPDNYHQLIAISAPAYHQDDSCELMHSKYINFDLPIGIKGIQDRVEKCRLLFDTIVSELKTEWHSPDDEYIVARNKLVETMKKDEQFLSWDSTLGLTLSHLSINSFPTIIKRNSGHENIEFYEKEICDLLHEFECEFGRIKMAKNLKRPEAIRMHAKQYFKKEGYSYRLFDLIVDFIISQYNPSLEFDREVLDAIGYKPCSKCTGILDIDLSTNCDPVKDYEKRMLDIYEIIESYGCESFYNGPDRPLSSWEEIKKQSVGSLHYCTHLELGHLQAVVLISAERAVFVPLPQDKRGNFIYLETVELVKVRRKNIAVEIHAIDKNEIILLPSN